VPADLFAFGVDGVASLAEDAGDGGRGDHLIRQALDEFGAILWTHVAEGDADHAFDASRPILSNHFVSDTHTVLPVRH
jgi:hypothetical protein